MITATRRFVGISIILLDWWFEREREREFSVELPLCIKQYFKKDRSLPHETNYTISHKNLNPHKSNLFCRCSRNKINVHHHLLPISDSKKRSRQRRHGVLLRLAQRAALTTERGDGCVERRIGKTEEKGRGKEQQRDEEEEEAEDGGVVLERSKTSITL